MQRNFYKKNDSYYYADNNQQIWDTAEWEKVKTQGLEITESQAIEFQEIEKEYISAAGENPVIKNLLNGGSSIEDIILGLETGDISGLKKADGLPFSIDEQQKALARAQDDIKAGYETIQRKATDDAETKLAQGQDDYQNFLLNQGNEFRIDKAKLDQQSADRGVLFSGSRLQKQRNLEKTYNDNQAYAERAQARNINNTASDYQSKYGDKAARGLSQYYQVRGGNTFNSSVARGGVGTSGISSIYNTGAEGGYGIGSVGKDRQTQANIRAGHYLKNRSNQLSSSGYNNQL